ncbi:MAG: TetR/AcrR family transcriptional regulator [Xanthobacteraceae bacterium]|nr:TetR/AcrR family transcriptional regulator [Xanthobacteraceae bacterium]
MTRPLRPAPRSPRKPRPAVAAHKAPAKAAGTRSGKAAASKPYHHGDLRRVLVEAAFDLVAERGPETVSVREAARRAGVSPGAPFRHFESRDALMAAVAAEAQRRFRQEIATALAAVPADQPLRRFRALGLAYLRWAMRNPGHFEVISDGRLFDFDAAQGEASGLKADNAEIIDMSAQWLADASAKGLLRSADVKLMQIAGRALVYGYARMKADGHFPRWGVGEAEIEPMAEAVLDLFLAGIAKGDGPIKGRAPRA